MYSLSVMREKRMYSFSIKREARVYSFNIKREGLGTVLVLNQRNECTAL